MRDAWTVDLDPPVSPARRAAGDLTVGRMLINACKPDAWREQFAETNLFSAEERQKLQAKRGVLLADLGNH